MQPLAAYEHWYIHIRRQRRDAASERAGVARGRRLEASFIDRDNHHRLHSALGFVTPADALAGRAEAIWANRDQKREATRAQRRAAISSPPP